MIYKLSVSAEQSFEENCYKELLLSWLTRTKKSISRDTWKWIKICKKIQIADSFQ